MKATRYTLVVLAVAVLAAPPRPSDAAPGSTNLADRLRVLAIQPDCFEYEFMSTMSAGTSAPRLVFNHIGGATDMVRPGEMLGPYRVSEFHPLTERVFNPTINAEQEKKSGEVVLVDTNGVEIVLTMGRPLPLADGGQTACLVDLTSGTWSHVRAGEALGGDFEGMRVSSVSTDRVVIARQDETGELAWIGEDERQALSELWESRKQTAATEKALSQYEPEAESAPVPAAMATAYPQPESPPPARAKPPLGFMFGTTYSYPTEFEVMSVPTRTKDGKILYRPVVVPTRFELRQTGIGSR